MSIVSCCATPWRILRTGFRSAKAAFNSLSVSSLRMMRSVRIWVCEMILISFRTSANSLAKIVARSLFLFSTAFAQVLKRVSSLPRNLTMTCSSLNLWILSFGTASKITSSSVRGERKGFLIAIHHAPWISGALLIRAFHVNNNWRFWKSWRSRGSGFLRLLLCWSFRRLCLLFPNKHVR